MKTKVCTKCSIEKPLSAFSKTKKYKGKRYFRSHCNECRNKALKLYFEQNSDMVKRSWKRNMLKRYGMTIEQFDGLFESQNGRCRICRQKETSRNKDGKRKSLAVDHDHATGEVRGLLCYRCNVILGFADDNPKLFEAMIGYLASSGPGPLDRLNMKGSNL